MQNFESIGDDKIYLSYILVYKSLKLTIRGWYLWIIYDLGLGIRKREKGTMEEKMEEESIEKKTLGN